MGTPFGGLGPTLTRNDLLLINSSAKILFPNKGREALHLIHLPATSSVAENSPPETPVHKFSVNLSASLSPVTAGLPLIINTSPLTDAFKVVTTGKEELDFETGPNIFDLQIYVKDGVGVTDLQILTVQVTDVNEPPQFQGNLAKVFHLVAGVRDSQGLEASTALQVNVVNVNDEAPRFTSSARVYTIPEELASGTIVANITAEDPDDKGSTGFLLYSITTANSYFMINQWFGLATSQALNNHMWLVVTILDCINPGTGTIQVVHRLDRDAGDLRQNPTISLEVLVKDRPSGGQENRMQITFIVEDINDNPASCTRSTFSMEKLKPGAVVKTLNELKPTGVTHASLGPPTPSSAGPDGSDVMVPERVAKGTLLLDLNKFCFDDDSKAPNNQFNFTTPSGVGSGGRFSQDPAGSGKIVLIGDLDYENSSNLAAGNKYTVIIQVQDVAPPYYKSKYPFDGVDDAAKRSWSHNIYIYILTKPENEFPLVFDKPSYVFEVSELRPGSSSPAASAAPPPPPDFKSRTRVGQVHASDKDFPQSRVVYSISTGGASLQYPNIFWINPQTGELQLVTRADYETTPVYILRIQATNSEDTSTVTVTVNVLEENDEKPICTPDSYFLAVPVDLQVGTNIQNFKLTCTDLDSSPQSFRYSIGSGNVNDHFTFSPNAGSNITSLFLMTRFDYANGLDKIWDYKLLVYVTDDNLLSGRKKAQAHVETGTVTLSISIIPHPTTVVTTTPRPKIIYQVLRKNIYSPSAWYVPFVLTLGSILLLGLLVSLLVLLAKTIHRRCPRKTEKLKKPPAEKGETKNTKPEILVETIQLSSVFDGEAIDPVTGAVYEFNSNTGARKWKDLSTQMPRWKEPRPQGAASSRAVTVEGAGRPPRSIGEQDGPSGKAPTEDTSPGSRNQDGKMGTPKSRSPALPSRASPRLHPGK
ncbi:Cadherin-related family member 3 [Vulpes lagopus]